MLFLFLILEFNQKSMSNKICQKLKKKPKIIITCIFKNEPMIMVQIKQRMSDANAFRISDMKMKRS